MNKRQQDAKELVEFLGGPMTGWRTGFAIRTILTWSERRLRDAAEASDGRVLSAPGCSLGYRLAEGCDPKEYGREVRGRYVSQIRRMEERLRKMDMQFQWPGFEDKVKI